MTTARDKAEADWTDLAEPDWTEVHTAMDRIAEDFFQTSYPQAVGQIRARKEAENRRKAESERVEAERRRKMERRETIAFWSSVGGNVLPWIAAGVGGISALIALL